MDYDKSKTTDNYKDAEEILDSKDNARLISNLAAHYLADIQEANKGKLLAHYKSVGLSKTYIDIYERAIVGRMKNLEKKTSDVSFGYAILDATEVNGSTIYFKMKYNEIYCVHHLKMAERIAYQINRQKVKAMKE